MRRRVLLRDRTGDRHEACSAGITAGVVHPPAVPAMADRRTDTSKHRGQALPQVLDARPLDCTLTPDAVAERLCPSFSGTGARLHGSLPDLPTDGGYREERTTVLRVVRDTTEATIRPWLDKPVRGEMEDADPVSCAGLCGSSTRGTPVGRGGSGADAGNRTPDYIDSSAKDGASWRC